MHAKEYFTSYDDFGQPGTGSQIIENSYQGDITPERVAAQELVDNPRDALDQHLPYNRLSPPAQDVPEASEYLLLEQSWRI